MARIKAKDLDTEKKLGKKDLKKVHGGWGRSVYWCADGDVSPIAERKALRKKPSLPESLTSRPRGSRGGSRGIGA